MQESLIEYKGITCDRCGKPSKDHTYHQVVIFEGGERQEYGDIYLCTKCYKLHKAGIHD